MTAADNRGSLDAAAARRAMMPLVNCESCGAEARPGTRFCVQCGQPIGGQGGEVPPPPPSSLPPPPAPAMSPPPPVQAMPPPPTTGGYPIPPQAAPVAPQVNDPHAVGLQASRLGSGARRAGRLALGIASALLDDSEVVDVLVQGRFLGSPGVVLVTSSRVLVVNDAQWKPAVRSIPLVNGVTVQGWQDERVATLVIRHGDEDTTVDRITDRLIARELANKIRSRVSEVPGGEPEAPTPVEEF